MTDLEFEESITIEGHKAGAAGGPIMSQQIKFRAWNSKMKRMFTAEEMTADQMALLPNGFFANIHGADTRLSIIYPHQSMLPLQFTGLKDKKGVEIYEGDILHVESGNTYGDADVRFEQGSFCLKTVTDYTFWLHFLEDDAVIEVIGNIYENPELIEAQS